MLDWIVASFVGFVAGVLTTLLWAAYHDEDLEEHEDLRDELVPPRPGGYGGRSGRRGPGGRRR